MCAWDFRHFALGAAFRGHFFPFFCLGFNQNKYEVKLIKIKALAEGKETNGVCAIR